MRVSVLLALLVGCGNDVGMEPDALPQPQPVEPRVIAGGGIGDGPIAGVVNLYVIDNATRKPVANATVRVGTVDGATDADGLFVAHGVEGPQTISAKANGYRSEVWVGANGANVTLNIEAANTPTPATGTLMASITNFASVPVVAGHARVALATYSQSDELGDEANEIAQPANQNVCFGDTCNFRLTSRTGKVAVIAAIFDQDSKGTTDPADDTQTLVGWAFKTGLTVTANGTQTIALDVVPVSGRQTVTASFGTPPSGLAQVAGIVGIDLGAEGVLPLSPMYLTPANASVMAPRPEAISSSATYRFTAFATNGQTNPTTSIVVRRGLTGAAVSAGTWLAAPSGTPTRSGGSWSAATGATVTGVEYKQGATRVVNVSVFDGSTQVTIPDLVTMPTGTLSATLQSLGAPGLDVTSFSLDADRAKLAMVGAVTVSL